MLIIDYIISIFLLTLLICFFTKIKKIVLNVLSKEIDLKNTFFERKYIIENYYYYVSLIFNILGYLSFLYIFQKELFVINIYFVISIFMFVLICKVIIDYYKSKRNFSIKINNDFVIKLFDFLYSSFLLLIMYVNLYTALLLNMNENIAFGGVVNYTIVNLYITYSLKDLFKYVVNFKFVSYILEKNFILSKINDNQSSIEIDTSDVTIDINSIFLNNEIIPYHIILKKSQNYLIYGKSGIGKTYLKKVMIGEVRNSGVEIYINQYSLIDLKVEDIKNIIADIKIEELKESDELCFLNNLKSDICYVFKELKILHLLEKYDFEKLTDSEKLLIVTAKSILNNRKVLIFDNVLSRFSIDDVNNIISLCKKLNLIILVFEINEIDYKWDNIINLDKIGVGRYDNKESNINYY